MDKFPEDLTGSLKAVLYHDGKFLYSCSVDGELEIGRRDASEPASPCLAIGKSGRRKLVVAELDFATIPRSFALLEVDVGNTVRISNLHQVNSFSIVGREPVGAKQSTTVKVPLTLILPGGFTLDIVEERAQSVSNELSVDSQMVFRSKPSVPFENLKSPNKGQDPKRLQGTRLEHSILGTIVNAPTNKLSIDASEFLELLDFVILTAQKSALSAEFYSGVAEAVTRLIDMDRAEVLLWDGTNWQRSDERSYFRTFDEASRTRSPSYSLLNKALLAKRIVVHPDDSLELGAASLRELVAAIACPILDEHGEVIGVLFADRVTALTSPNRTVTKIEEKLIEILATAIATGIAKLKRESLVATYQQFFSSKVVDAIKDNPELLVGENCEVTVLFCDIRGFSRITDRIGPESAMLWIQDTLSELSNQVLDLNGVLVDYVGDELFAMWGAPDKQPNHTFCAVTAARNMMAMASELSNRWKDSIPEGFSFGIGICTGPAQVGNTGSKRKFKYGPMGRTVNLGSRIQGLTSHWRVQTLMNETAASRLSADIPQRRICQARVKGMEGNIGIFELVPDHEKHLEELRREYELALQKFEQGDHLDAASAFGELVKRYPNDGPSRLMLVRAFKELAEPSETFDPVWVAPSK